MYKDKMYAPMGWHWFTRWIRVPLGFVFSIISIAVFELNSQNLNSWIQVYLMVEMIIFELGAKKWKRSAYKAIMRLETANLIIAGYNAITGGANGIAYAIGYAIFPTIDLIYYRNRQLLFDDIEWNRLTDTVHVCMSCGNIQSGSFDKDFICKACGKKTYNTKRTVYSWLRLKSDEQKNIISNINYDYLGACDDQPIEATKIIDSNIVLNKENSNSIAEDYIPNNKTNNCHPKFCRKCGIALEGNLKFCYKCGTKIIG